MSGKAAVSRGSKIHPPHLDGSPVRPTAPREYARGRAVRDERRQRETRDAIIVLRVITGWDRQEVANDAGVSRSLVNQICAKAGVFFCRGKKSPDYRRERTANYTTRRQRVNVGRGVWVVPKNGVGFDARPDNLIVGRFGLRAFSDRAYELMFARLAITLGHSPSARDLQRSDICHGCIFNRFHSLSNIRKRLGLPLDRHVERHSLPLAFIKKYGYMASFKNNAEMLAHEKEWCPLTADQLAPNKRETPYDGTRALNALTRAGLTLEDAVALTPERLFEIPGIGARAIEWIQNQRQKTESAAA